MTATTPPPGAEKFSVHLLGCFELRRDQVPLPVTPSAQRLLAYLATRTGMVARPATAATLWPDFPDRRATANLRSALWRLRQEHAGGPVHCTPYGIELRPDVLVDVELIRARSAELPAAGDDACGLDPSVLSQDVLPDWPDEWLLPTREWFRQVRLHALDALCARHRRCGRYDAALDAGMRAVACEPLPGERPPRRRPGSPGRGQPRRGAAAVRGLPAAAARRARPAAVAALPRPDRAASRPAPRRRHVRVTPG
ncbi:hypothetical protein NE235_05670 [Actinoallomurus spadix]|uniref:Bacterial transcriptional activator domain-containing protein n=1 Tax=Actinoallomurus spadix TaxID=79912 RepID=A0ABP3FS05_9ACTN|nr:hypothetical protein [Actinoallomurus spadix]MCO5985592.1 hypothetical protein [Actinoallomurus spadix]